MATPRYRPAIRSRIVNNVNGLAMHALEAGFQTKGRPCILLLHGFPELAYGWRKVMLPLAAAGYHVVAPAACATARQCSKSKAPLQEPDTSEQAYGPDGHRECSPPESARGCVSIPNQAVESSTFYSGSTPTLNFEIGSRQIAVFSLTFPPRQPCASGGDDASMATARRKQCP